MTACAAPVFPGNARDRKDRSTRLGDLTYRHGWVWPKAGHDDWAVPTVGESILPRPPQRLTLMKSDPGVGHRTMEVAHITVPQVTSNWDMSRNKFLDKDAGPMLM
jgi:hypothetical protein